MYVMLFMPLLFTLLPVKALGGISPVTFFKEMLPAIMFAFSSASSVGTLPINIECTEKLGVSKEISSFILPLGATINMDGTAIYQGVCAIFIASCYGIHLTLPQMLTIIFTATLASIGTAGVPGAGMVMLAMVLTSVGLPVDGIALVAGVDRIFDMGRTTVNITGDASCCVVVSNLEKKREARKLTKTNFSYRNIFEKIQKIINAHSESSIVIGRESYLFIFLCTKTDSTMCIFCYIICDIAANILIFLIYTMVLTVYFLKFSSLFLLFHRKFSPKPGKKTNEIISTIYK